MSSSPKPGRSGTATPRGTPLPPRGICPPLRASSVTGSVSGSASPLTRYGSFPPPLDGTEDDQLQRHIEERLRSSLSSSQGYDHQHHQQQRRDEDAIDKTTGTRGRRMYRSWSKSTERVLRKDREILFDSEEEETDDERLLHSNEHGGLLRPSKLKPSNGRAGMNETTARNRSKGPDTHWGVRKMELMHSSWSRKTYMTLYAGVYLISALTSLEANTTPTIEPYYVSYLGSHTSLSTLVIVSSVAFAVGKPPFAKILDTFGRAEGIALAATIFALGYLMAACATSIPVFLVAKALAALGAQGIQLAQQIIIADTTTLTNRGLITSTISLPWLMTTWIGPPLGAMFQSIGPTGYRTAYALFALLLPLVSGLLVLTLFAQWKRTKRLDARLLGPEMVEVSSIKTLSQPVVAWTGKARAVWAELDIVGLITLTAGCIFLLVPFTIAQQRPAAFGDGALLFTVPVFPTPWPSNCSTSGWIWAMIAFGLGTLVFFWKYESSMAKLPLLPPRLLADRTILCGSALGFFHFASQFCYESFFTSFLQVARGHSPRDASYISQSYIFAASISAILAGIGAKWSQRYKWIGIVGALTHLGGTCLMLRTRNLDSSTFELVLSQVVGGVGGGFTTIAAQIGCQSVVSHQDVGIATAIFLTLTQVGGAVGGAIAGGIWSSLLPRRLRSHLPSESHDIIPDIMSSLPYAISFERGTAIRNAIDRSYVDVQRLLNVVAIALLLPAIVAVCAMRNVHLEKEDQGQNGVVVLGTASHLPLTDDEAGEEGILGREDTTSSETSSLLREAHGTV